MTSNSPAVAGNPQETHRYGSKSSCHDLTDGIALYFCAGDEYFHISDTFLVTGVA
jgi:hypothetical protein